MQKLLLLFLFTSTLIGNSQTTENDNDRVPKHSSEELTVLIDSLLVKMSDEFYQNNFDKVLEYGDVAINYSKEINKPDLGIKASRFIGSALIKLRDTVTARSIFQKSLTKAKSLNDIVLLSKCLNDLGNFHNEIDEKDKAIAYYLKALNLTDNLKAEDKRQANILNFNLADIYLVRKDVAAAKPHIKNLSDNLNAIEHPILKSGYYSLKSKLYVLTKEPELSIYFQKKHLAMAKEMNYVDGIIDGYSTYIDALVLKNDYRKVHEMQLELNKYKDEKFESEKSQALQEVTSKMNLNYYKQELKAKDLENELNKQKVYKRQVVLYVSAGTTLILVIFLISLLISFRNRKSLVTNLKESNLQLQEAKRKAEDLTKVKTNFLSAISHELRTPLYGIIGISSILKEDLKLEKHQEDIDSLKFSADYLLALVNDLLFLNKLDTFKDGKLDNKPFEPRKLVDNIISSFEFMRTKNNNQIECNIDENTPALLKGDFVKLSQILMNLIGNACKFTEEGNIIISIDSSVVEDNKVRLAFAISDNGLGISEEKQKVIFEEFTQDTSSNNFQGTGLGLSIVKKLLNLHNSPITLKSKKNVGTTFSFAIDYELAAATELKVIEKNIKVDKHIEGSHILIVDDNRINRLVTRKILERNDYICSTAENGKQATEMVKNELFDLVLMDVNMPVMNGIEATKLIREFNQTIPILALTAIDPKELGEDIKTIGFSDSIIKPYETIEFLEIIRRNFVCTIQI